LFKGYEWGLRYSVSIASYEQQQQQFARSPVSRGPAQSSERARDGHGSRITGVISLSIYLLAP
jgi:hypothetical protein